MGLLDGLLNNDQGLLGAYLLAAAGPRAQPANTGQRLLDALTGYRSEVQGREDRAQKQKMQDAQMQLLQAQLGDVNAQAQQRAAQAAQLQRRNSLFTDWLGQLENPASAANAATVQQTGNLAPTVQNGAIQSNAMSTTQRQNPLFGVPPAALRADLAFNDGKGISDMIFKRGVPNIDFVNGVAVDKNQTQPGFSVPTISQDGKASQLVADPTAQGGFRVIAPQGALDTYGAYRGIEEATKAGSDLIKVFNPQSGREEYVSRAQVLRAAQPGYSAPPIPSPTGTGPRYAPAPTTQEGQQARLAEVAGAEKDIQAWADGLRQRRSAQAPSQTSATANMGGPMAAGQSMAEKNAQGLNEAMTKKMADAVEASAQRAEGAQSTLRAVQQIEGALGSGKVMAGPGTPTRMWLSQVGNVAFGGGADGLVATRNAIQGLSRLTLESRGSLRGQGTITDREQALLERAQSGDIESMTPAEISIVVAAVKRTAQLQVKQHSEMMRRANANDWRSFFSAEGTPLADAASPATPDLSMLAAQEIARRQRARGGQ